MISNEWHYIVVRTLSALLTGITSKHDDDLYCLNCLNSFAIKNKPELQKKVCKSKDFCNFVMLSEDTKILKFNQYKESDKVPFNIYADLECLTEKIDGCKDNPINSCTTKLGEHISSAFLMSTISSFKITENNRNVFSGKYCMNKFCESLMKHVMEITDFKNERNKVINKRTAEII